MTRSGNPVAGRWWITKKPAYRLRPNDCRDRRGGEANREAGRPGGCQKDPGGVTQAFHFCGTNWGTSLVTPCFYLVIGGEGGIRTLDTFPYTHFPGVLLRPLGHLSAIAPGGRLCYRLRGNSRKPHSNLRSGVVLQFQVSLDRRSTMEPRISGNRPAMRTRTQRQHHG